MFRNRLNQAVFLQMLKRLLYHPEAHLSPGHPWRVDKDSVKLLISTDILKTIPHPCLSILDIIKRHIPPCKPGSPLIDVRHNNLTLRKILRNTNPHSAIPTS